MLKTLKLEAKFNLLLTLIFVVSILLSGVALSKVLQQRAQDEVIAKGLLLIQTMNSVRDYTSTHINPLLASQLETEPVFIPETVPAYSATEIFENLRKNQDYKNFFYKEATLNPTNLQDKADSFETQLVEQFRQQPQLKELSGFRTLPEWQVFYIARPLAIAKASCLRCHSTPEAAPKSLLTTYGTEWGFGWKLNEIVAAQIVSVPANEVFSLARQSFFLLVAILIGLFAVIVVAVNSLVRLAVLRPLRKMAKYAHDVSMGQISTDFEKTSDDEIGTLAAAFNRMKASHEIAINLLNRKK